MSYADSGDIHSSLLQEKEVYRQSTIYPPPLVILPGSAQTIDTWSLHVRPFLRSRRLIIPELRCHGTTTTLLSSESTINQLIKDVKVLLDALNIVEVDLCGFSLGGRVALAYASTGDRRIRRLSVTGVPYQRAPLGKTIIKSWHSGVDNNEMVASAWSFILNGYSDGYVAKQHEKIDKFVQALVKSNNSERLRDLFQCSLQEKEEDEYTVANCAPRIACPVQIIGGEVDRISDIPSMLALHKNIPGSQFIQIPQAGHLAPFEQPSDWRDHVLSFLDHRDS